MTCLRHHIMTCDDKITCIHCKCTNCYICFPFTGCAYQSKQNLVTPEHTRTLKTLDELFLTVYFYILSTNLDCDQIDCIRPARPHMNCTHCTCPRDETTVFNGRVVDSATRLPLPNVVVSPENYPQFTLATTDLGGR